MEGNLNINEQTIVTTCYREGTDAANYSEVCYNPLYTLTFYGSLVLIVFIICHFGKKILK